MGFSLLKVIIINMIGHVDTACLALLLPMFCGKNVPWVTSEKKIIIIRNTHNRELNLTHIQSQTSGFQIDHRLYKYLRLLSSKNNTSGSRQCHAKSRYKQIKSVPLRKLSSHLLESYSLEDLGVFAVTLTKLNQGF